MRAAPQASSALSSQRGPLSGSASTCQPCCRAMRTSAGQTEMMYSLPSGAVTCTSLTMACISSTSPHGYDGLASAVSGWVVPINVSIGHEAHRRGGLRHGSPVWCCRISRCEDSCSFSAIVLGPVNEYFTSRRTPQNEPPPSSLVCPSLVTHRQCAGAFAMYPGCIL